MRCGKESLAFVRVRECCVRRLFELLALASLKRDAGNHLADWVLVWLLVCPPKQVPGYALSGDSGCYRNQTAT